MSIKGKSFSRSTNGSVGEFEYVNDNKFLEHQHYENTGNGFVIFDSLFKNNHAELDGGHIYIDGENVYVSIDSCDFSGGESLFGSDISSYLSKGVLIEKSTFFGGQVGDQTSGSLFFTMSALTFLESYIGNVHGTCIFSTQSYVGVTKSIIESCTEGGIKILDVRDRRSSIDISTSYDPASSAGEYYIAAMAGYSSSVYDSNIMNNFVTNDGGGIFLANSHHDEIYVMRNNFTNNKAFRFGGGFHIESSTSLVRFGTNIFTKNRATYGGSISVSNVPSFEFSFGRGKQRKGLDFADSRAIGGGVLYDDSFNNENTTLDMFLAHNHTMVGITSDYGGWFSSRPILIRLLNKDEVISVFPGEKFDIEMELIDRIGQSILCYPKATCTLEIYYDDNTSMMSKSQLIAANLQVVLSENNKNPVFSFKDVSIQQQSKDKDSEVLRIICDNLPNVPPLEVDVELQRCSVPYYGLEFFI